MNRAQYFCGLGVYGDLYVERPRCVFRCGGRYCDEYLTIQKSKCKNIKCCGCECDRDPTLPDPETEETLSTP